MNNSEWLLNMTYEQREEWLEAEHADGDMDNDVSVQKRPDESCRQYAEQGERAELPDCESDSREKLEADVGFIVKEGFVTYKGIINLLDRQAAITANETSHDNPYVGLIRGKQWERTEISDYYCGRCGWKVTDHDSYCPECGGALHKASNKPDGKSVAPKTAETAETCAAKCDICDFDDSREKLEADCTATWKSVERIVRSGGTPKDRWTNNEFFKLLDRQAAITERECRHENYAEGDVYRKVYTKSHIDEMIRDAKRELELQRERNTELQAALDQQRSATANANDLWGRTRDELAAVKAERDNLADDLLASNREREHLRRTLGIALDHAHDMLALVNLDGEVVS